MLISHDGPDSTQPKLFLTYFLLAVTIVAAPLGNVLLGMGMKHVGPLSLWPLTEFLSSGLRVFGTTTIWLGIGLLLAFFVAYMLVLSLADYSFVQPSCSLSYGVVALLGRLMLGEQISALRWAGIAVICLGVFIVARGTARTTERG